MLQLQNYCQKNDIFSKGNLGRHTALILIVFCVILFSVYVGLVAVNLTHRLVVFLFRRGIYIMTNIELAKRRLFDQSALDLSNFKIYPGTSRDVTPDKFAEEINKMLSQIDAEDFEEMHLE